MNYGQVAQRFVALVEEFCRWVEGAPLSLRQEHDIAMQFVARLYLGGLGLPDCEPSDNYGWVKGLPYGEYKKAHSRFASLPLQYYAKIFNPLVLPTEEPVVADVHDDLADMYRDLKVGLGYWYQGEAENAVFSWKASFEFHWGSHAISALAALHSYAADEDQL